MPQTIHVIYENGVFRPIERVNFPEHQKVEIVIQEDIPGNLITVLAEKAGSFNFLSASGEDIYTINDGEPI